MKVLKYGLWVVAIVLIVLGVAGLFTFGDENARCLPGEDLVQCQNQYRVAGVVAEVLFFGLAAALIAIYYLMKRKGFFVPKG